MGFGFRKSIKILPGVRVNVGTSGVSTTIGGRGGSVNIGKRGTHLNAGVPGTGLSYRARMDGGSGSMGSGGGAGNGCPGCLGGFFVLVIMGTCIGSDPSSPPSSPPLSIYETSAPPAPSADIHEPLNVRSEPNKQGATLRTLPRGSAVRLGPKDGNGWAPLYDYAGNAEGYVYRASDAVRSFPAPERTHSTPRARAASAGVRRRSPAESRGYYTGPRGGCYTYSASGRKRYVDRSYCN